MVALGLLSTWLALRAKDRDEHRLLPASIAALAPAVKEIRDAYEHIDERTLGQCEYER
jgi:hypothetical protein